jgi:hypothetical protein
VSCQKNQRPYQPANTPKIEGHRFQLNNLKPKLFVERNERWPAHKKKWTRTISQEMLNEHPRHTLPAIAILHGKGSQFKRPITMWLELTTAHELAVSIFDYDETSPIQIHRVDANTMNEITDLDGVSFDSRPQNKICHANLGSHQCSYPQIQPNHKAQLQWFTLVGWAGLAAIIPDTHDYLMNPMHPSTLENHSG